MRRKRALIVVVAAVVVGSGAVGGLAMASSDRTLDGPTSRGGGSVSTATVVRTNLASAVQVGGSIGYQGSYTITVPSGASAQQIAQDQQAVTQAQQTLSADQTSASDASVADVKAVASAKSSADTASSSLSADQAKEQNDCAGDGASTTTCGQDAQKVAQDQQAVTQAQQQLTTAEQTTVRDRDQNQAKVAADTIQLHAAQANLAALAATAANPGTTYTELPKVGQTISEDQAVYALNNLPVPLLYGPVVAYRPFEAGMSPGADVSELSGDLIALGYGAGLAQSDAYTAAIAAAVRRWQSALGLPATGQILLGEVVFEPGPIRVTSVTPSVGQALGGGGGSGGGGGATVLTATSTTPVVTVALQVTEEYLVKPGDAVTVVLPDGTSTVGGKVQTVGDVATCPGGGGSGSGSGIADLSPCSSSGGGNNSTPTVAMTVSLDTTPPGATLDQAPVNVNITSQTADGVLAVPVNALLALQGGGYGVEVVSGSTTHLVAVSTGLYSNTLVEVSGAGITAGTKVEVPSK